MVHRLPNGRSSLAETIWRALLPYHHFLSIPRWREYAGPCKESRLVQPVIVPLKGRNSKLSCRMFAVPSVPHFLTGKPTDVRHWTPALAECLPPPFQPHRNWDRSIFPAIFAHSQALAKCERNPIWHLRRPRHTSWRTGGQGHWLSGFLTV